MSTTETYETTGPGVGKKTGRNASAEAVVEAIQRPEQRDRHDYYVSGAEGMLPTMELPGFGEEREDCGDPIDFFCDTCFRTNDKREEDSTYRMGRTCNQSTCPRCASSWCRDRAENAVAYLKALRYARYFDTGRDQLFHHVVLSPPEDWELAGKDAYEKTWDVVKEILAELGLKGYVGYHPWSGNDEVDDDRGEWADRLFEGRDFEGDVKEELEGRPHFHVVGVADFVKGGELTKRVEEETGWIIARITKNNSNKSIAGDDERDELKDLASVVSYVISHTGLKATEAGNMSAQWRNVGFKESEINVHTDTHEQARAVVRAVVWKTLGIPSAQLQCEANVAAPEGHDHGEDDECLDQAGATDDRDLDPVAGPGGSSDDWSSGGRSNRSVSVEPCDGSLLVIAKAPNYIHDRSNDHPRLDDVQDLYEWWQDQEDWIG